MKAGFEVHNLQLNYGDDIILVDNYELNNTILNIPIPNDFLTDFKKNESIGVWKLKSLNK